MNGASAAASTRTRRANPHPRTYKGYVAMKYAVQHAVDTAAQIVPEIRIDVAEDVLSVGSERISALPVEGQEVRWDRRRGQHVRVRVPRIGDPVLYHVSTPGVGGATYDDVEPARLAAVMYEITS